MTADTTLSDSPTLHQWLATRLYGLGLVEATERELGSVIRASEGDSVAVREILTECRERGYIVTADDAVPGSRVRTTSPLAPAYGTVDSTTALDVIVDWGVEQTPGVPGSRYTRFLPTALFDGVLKQG